MKINNPVSTILIFSLLISVAGCIQKEKPKEIGFRKSVTSIQATVVSISEPQPDSIIFQTLTSFKKALKNDNPVLFDSIIGTGGFTIVRNFTSGGAGSRGENIRFFYSSPINKKFESLSFPVPKECPVEINKMFAEMMAKSENGLPILE